MKKLLLPLLLLICWLSVGMNHLAAQATRVVTTFQWSDQPQVYYLDNESFEAWEYEGAKFGDNAPSHPVWVHRFPTTGYGTLEVQVLDVQWEVFTKRLAPEDDAIGTELQFATNIVREPEGFLGKFLVFHLFAMAISSSGRFL
ncbi:MAG: hypothetical protein R2795_01620 [Saprospiraceae bacterium]